MVFPVVAVLPHFLAPGGGAQDRRMSLMCGARHHRLRRGGRRSQVPRRRRSQVPRQFLPKVPHQFLPTHPPVPRQFSTSVFAHPSTWLSRCLRMPRMPLGGGAKKPHLPPPGSPAQSDPGRQAGGRERWQHVRQQGLSAFCSGGCSLVQLPPLAALLVVRPAPIFMFLMPFAPLAVRPQVTRAGGLGGGNSVFLNA